MKCKINFMVMMLLIPVAACLLSTSCNRMTPLAPAPVEIYSPQLMLNREWVLTKVEKTDAKGNVINYPNTKVTVVTWLDDGSYLVKGGTETYDYGKWEANQKIVDGRYYYTNQIQMYSRYLDSLGNTPVVRMPVGNAIHQGINVIELDSKELHVSPGSEPEAGATTVYYFSAKD